MEAGCSEQRAELAQGATGFLQLDGFTPTPHFYLCAQPGYVF